MLSQHHANIDQLLTRDPDYKKYIFNQRFLMKCLTTYLKSGEYLNELDSNINKIYFLLDLKNMLCEEGYTGWLFKDIVAELLNKPMSVRIKCSFFKPPIFLSNEELKSIEELNKWFGEIHIYPILFKRSFSCELFNTDISVNTFNALYLLKVAGDIISKSEKIVPQFVSEDTNIEAIESYEKQLYDKKIYILLILLAPHVYKLFQHSKYNLTDAITTIRQWDASTEIAPIIEKDSAIPENEKFITIWTYNGNCAIIQNMLLDMLKFLPAIQELNLHADYDASLKKPRETLPRPLR
jgi:hypothetical protein